MQSELVTYIESIEGVRSVNASESVAESFASFGKLLSYVSLAIIVILVCVAVFLISNTVMIGITVRHEEIAIMKYLGATDFFVRAPFLVEGMLIGLIGSLIPVAVLRVLYEKVIEFVTTEFSILNSILTFMPADDIFRILIPISLIIGLGIGFIGSYLTLLKHVRV
jgi:cell division transport system permease protein